MPSCAARHNAGMIDAAEQHAAIVARIREANHRYYVLDDPDLPDADYDLLMRQLEALEA